MSGSLLPVFAGLVIRLFKAVAAIVNGMANSIQATASWMMPKTLKAKVMLCPMVKAVTRMATFRQSLNWYRKHNAETNNMWSSADQLRICSTPSPK